MVAGGFEAEPAVRLFADGDLAVAGDAVALRVVGGQTQAFFTKVYIEEDDELRVENARPFEMLLDPEVNADALTWAANADKARTPALDSSGQGSSLVRWAPPAGLEPATYGLEGRCSIH